MTDDVEWETRLRALPSTGWPEFLTAHSGLPGPRANLALVSAIARTAEPAVIAELEKTDDEFAMMCVAASRGARSDDADVLRRLRGHAEDQRWRVREGAVIGLQLLGDRDIAALLSIVKSWAEETDPLLQRAAVAAICEPRLLRDPRTVGDALGVCATTTAHFVTWPSERRRAPDVRVLRQTLGYCWSVVVSADPDIALDAFLGLDSDHPDVGWIVAQNLRKSRLSRILRDRGEGVAR